MPLLGLESPCCCWSGPGASLFISSTLLLYACRRCVGLPCFRASAVAQLPLAETGRPLAVSLLGLLDPAQPPQARPRPAATLLRAGGDVQSPFTGHAALAMRASGANSWWLGAFLVNPGGWAVQVMGCCASWHSPWTCGFAGLLSPRWGVLALAQIEALRAVGAGRPASLATIGKNLPADPGILGD